MKSFRDQAAQGDLLIRRINELPRNIVRQNAQDGRHIVAHSETGHHHTVDDTAEYYSPPVGSPEYGYVMYLKATVPTVLRHHRSHDTHAPIRIDPGVYELRRQREYVPEGFRRVED